MSTSDGYTYGILNGSLVEGELSGSDYGADLVGVADLSVQFYATYNNSVLSDPISSGDDRLKNMDTGSATVTLTAGTRTKVAEFASGKDLAKKGFDSITFGATTTVTINFAPSDAGATLSPTKIFYRIAGDAADSSHSVVEATSYDVTSNTDSTSSLVQGVVTSSIGTITWAD